MLKLLLVIIFASFALAAEASTDTSSSPDNPYGLTGADTKILPVVREAIRLKEDQTGKGYKAIMALTDFMFGPKSQSLSPKARYIVTRLYAQIRFDEQEYEDAMETYGDATQYEGATEDDWLNRFKAALYINKYSDADVAFTSLSKRWPDVITRLDRATIYRFERGLLTIPKSEEPQMAFETCLFQAGWFNGRDDDLSQNLRFHYAEHLIDKGDMNNANTIASGITDPHTLLIMHADKRFDPIIKPNEDKFDVSSAKKAMFFKKSTNDFRGSFPMCDCASYAAMLYESGMFDESLREIDNLLKRITVIAGLERKKNPYFDLDYEKILRLRAMVLFALGRTDEALGVASALRRENCCDTNLEMPITMAQLLTWLGRGKEAAEHIDVPAAGESLPEDDAIAASQDACGAAEDGDTRFVKESLSKLDTALYEPGAVLQGYLCANDLDGAAQLVVKALADPQTRPMMLDQLETFYPLPTQTEFQKAMQKKLDQLRVRADVHTAVQAVGRLHYDFVIARRSWLQ